MSALSTESINRVITSAMKAITTPKFYIKGHDELTEGIADTPMIEIYLSRIESNSPSGQTINSTFGGIGVTPVQQELITFHIDLYVAPGHIEQWFPTAYPVIDAIRAKLKEQTRPIFGLTGIEAMSWTAEYATIERAQQSYPGFRFVIEMTIN